MPRSRLEYLHHILDEASYVLKDVVPPHWLYGQKGKSPRIIWSNPFF